MKKKAAQGGLKTSHPTTLGTQLLQINILGCYFKKGHKHGEILDTLAVPNEKIIEMLKNKKYYTSLLYNFCMINEHNRNSLEVLSTVRFTKVVKD